jgi:large subunit ribosomal protein L22
MSSSAFLKNYRVSPRKARLLADQIRGKGVEDALVILDLSPKRFARALAKLVRSALANAEEKNTREHAGIDIDNLVVGKIHVDQGPSMWSVRPRAQGRANWIQKRTANVRVVLSEEH